MVAEENGLRRVIDPRTGLVHEVRMLPVGTLEPRVFMAVAVLARVRAYLGRKAVESGGGAGFTSESATGRAVGEVLERYAATCYNRSSFIQAPWVEVADEAVPLEHLEFYAAEQYASPGWPFQRPARGQPASWVWGQNLLTGERTLLPAQLVFMLYKPFDGEPVWFATTSSGLALATSFNDAASRALCELIERDALVVSWLCRLPARRISVPQDHEIRARIARSPFGLVLWDVTRDIAVPTVMAVLLSPQAGAAAATGGACSLDIHQACEKAAIEAAQTRAWLCQMLDAAGGESLPAAVDTFEDHVRLYGNSMMLKELEFLAGESDVDLKTSSSVPSNTPQCGLQNIVGALASRDLTPYVVDITPEDLAECGLHVVRALVPGLVPIYASERHRPLGLRRLSRCNPKEGARALNPAPHPFP